VRRNGLDYECALCGATLEGVVDHDKVRVKLEGNQHGRVRVLLVDGREVHRCSVPSDT
jgi:hypothetical protein